jgi:hypothetical protein
MKLNLQEKANTLFKSTIVIYSDFDPTTVELDTLASEATRGSAICTDFQHKQQTKAEAAADPQSCGVVEFFGLTTEGGA